MGERETERQRETDAKSPLIVTNITKSSAANTDVSIDVFALGNEAEFH
jgi:hypothetical protein